MPAGDRTGPMGMGPRTGRGGGYCAGNDAPGWGFGPLWRRGGSGRGGRRNRNWYRATGMPRWARFGYGPAWGAPAAGGYAPYDAAPAPEQEVGFLRQQAEWLTQQLDAIGRRIEELSREE